MWGDTVIEKSHPVEPFMIQWSYFSVIYIILYIHVYHIYFSLIIVITLQGMKTYNCISLLYKKCDNEKESFLYIRVGELRLMTVLSVACGSIHKIFILISNFLSYPFTADIDTFICEFSELELELIDMQAGHVLNGRLTSVTFTEFYKFLSLDKLTWLKSIDWKIFSVLGSSYTKNPDTMHTCIDENFNFGFQRLVEKCGDLFFLSHLSACARWCVICTHIIKTLIFVLFI